jgi:hypothetical protein
MTHRLTPRHLASQRNLDELIDALRESFPFVNADRDKGADHIGDMIAHFFRIKKGYSRWKSPPPQDAQIDATIERLDGLRNNAAFIVVAEDENDEDQCITFNLVPGEPIVVGYANQKHQDTAGPITSRVAEVLGYDAEEI